jgi:hypothetical protein
MLRRGLMLFTVSDLACNVSKKFWMPLKKVTKGAGSTHKYTGVDTTEPLLASAIVHDSMLDPDVDKGQTDCACPFQLGQILFTFESK